MNRCLLLCLFDTSVVDMMGTPVHETWTCHVSSDVILTTTTTTTTTDDNNDNDTTTNNTNKTRIAIMYKLYHYT